MPGLFYPFSKRVATPAIVTPAPLPRLVYLRKKAAKLSTLIAMEKEFTELNSLYAKLGEVKKEIVERTMNPLEYELCVEEPWAMECRVYDP